MKTTGLKNITSGLLPALLACLQVVQAGGADTNVPGRPTLSEIHSNIIHQALEAHRAIVTADEERAAANDHSPKPVIISQHPSPLDRSLAKNSNAISGLATNGCQLVLRLATNAVAPGTPLTIYVIIQNGSDQPVFYSLSSSEAPWFCKFRVLDEHGNEFPISRERPYFDTGQGGGIPPGYQDEYEIRLDRIYAFSQEGKYYIYGKKIFNWVKSGGLAELKAGPAVLQVVQPKESH